MKLLSLLALWCLFSASVFADTVYRCSNCYKEVSKLYELRGITGDKKMVCSQCNSSTPHCAICLMPVKKGAFKKLDDGRIFCSEDLAAGVFTQTELDDIAKQTLQEMERAFYRFGMKFPGTNVTVSLVPADRLYALSGNRYDPARPEINGFTSPTFFDASGVGFAGPDVVKLRSQPSRIEYKVYVVNGLPRARLMAVCAHEFGHVWHTDNLPLGRTLTLEGKTREAFCELIAYQLMSAVQQPFEQAVIRANLYTAGQAELLMELERDYGFKRILDWMKNGRELQLNRANLDHIRLVTNEASQPTGTASIFGDAPPVKIPDTLLLKGIMGSGTKRMALINNQSFFTSESAKVKVGTTNVTVQVLEIRTGSVLIRTNGAELTEEIFLAN